MRYFTPQELQYLEAANADDLYLSDRAKFDYLKHFGAVDRYSRDNFPDVFAEPKEGERKTFRIGNATCQMTERQAKDWSIGNIAAWTMAGATVTAIDGSELTEPGKSLKVPSSLWVFIQVNSRWYREHMEDEDATPCEAPSQKESHTNDAT